MAADETGSGTGIQQGGEGESRGVGGGRGRKSDGVDHTRQAAKDVQVVRPFVVGDVLHQHMQGAKDVLAAEVAVAGQRGRIVGGGLGGLVVEGAESRTRRVTRLRRTNVEGSRVTRGRVGRWEILARRLGELDAARLGGQSSLRRGRGDGARRRRRDADERESTAADELLIGGGRQRGTP